MITRQDIEQDIQRFDRRITRLKCQLMDIPAGFKRDRRKEQKKRDKIQKEILHVQGLRQMALDALE